MRVPTQVVERNRVNHTLLKRLVEAGSFGGLGKKQFAESDFAEWMYNEATEDDVVEAPLHVRINEARKEKKRNKSKPVGEG